ncbi:MAG: AbrB/MazE/SpoVT family DNA-binding domain-containing protein [Gammaproteobacteria bacterium]|nr:AbrB/MazE/SpoVT family DNA-binding domain-containing protein [Gammaproteobacteria bacterium]
MKLKVSTWGNSQAVRLPSAVLTHLNVTTGAELEVCFTDDGAIQITKAAPNQDTVQRHVEQAIAQVQAMTAEVTPVANPYVETSVDYLVVTINPLAPMIREVPKGTPGAYATLVAAKDAARQVIQHSLQQAQRALAELRQVGVEKITYIAL